MSFSVSNKKKWLTESSRSHERLWFISYTTLLLILKIPNKQIFLMRTKPERSSVAFANKLVELVKNNGSHNAGNGWYFPCHVHKWIKESNTFCMGLTVSSASHSSSGHSHLSKQCPDIVQRSSPLDWSKTNSRQASSQTENSINQIFQDCANYLCIDSERK